jgi:1-acyl-sn-glycerol-3-phosphate acyltransferase
MTSVMDPPSGTSDRSARPSATGSRQGGLAWISHVLYGTYALTVLALLMLVLLLLVFLTPRLAWRRWLTRTFARAWLALAGLRLRVAGLDTLPRGSCVLVANHSSYLDGVALKAALPPRFSFVIKREAASLPVVGFVLRRIGAEFVDRKATHRDARRVVRRAEEGDSLVFFPEGTFDAQVGIKRFKIGAFVAAARGNSQVVPTAIRGTRRALSSGHLVPRPGRIDVDVLVPVGGHGESPEQLQDEARRLIVERVGEPDLDAREPA